ncbi:MAG: hypothetical protein HYT93_01125 [Parcubacteria group bacterium]|nr:hypothetical protein [Parcubacteria group bacterium]
MESQSKTDPKIIAGGVIVLLIIAVGLWYVFQKEKPPVGVVETAKDVSESVPQIQTNPGEDVPEINPLDRANPFKYNNPLR